MNEQDFRHFLKRSGKKEHVIDGLVGLVSSFEGLDEASEADIQAYATRFTPGEMKKRLRALALYYRFAGNEPLARLASSLREGAIAQTRTSFMLRDFRGVQPGDTSRLEAAGIITVDDLLAAGSTPAARQRLAEKTGVSPAALLELVKLSDLSRLGAVKSVRARLYYDAGFDTPEKLKGWEPEALRKRLVEWVASSGFDGIAPLPKELRNLVAAARSLPQAVDYDEL